MALFLSPITFIYYAIVTTFMSILEYRQWYHGKIDRIRTLYHEASKLGQDKRAKEFVDELYELGFNHYQRMIKVMGVVKERIEREKNPGLRKILIEIEGDLSSSSEKYSEVLNRFVLDTIRLTRI